MSSLLMKYIGCRRLLLKILLIKRLGLINILRVIRHRLRLRNKYYEQALPVVAVPTDVGFWVHEDARSRPSIDLTLQASVLERANEVTCGWFRRFEDDRTFEGKAPEWHKVSYASSKDEHFSHVKLNESPGADVKLCWDLSRFKWVTQLAIAAAVSTDEDKRRMYLDRSEDLLGSWVAENGYFMGVNWACGQEVSIRGLHLMVSTFIYETHFNSRPAKGLLALMQASYERVKLTIDYSLAQDNNHSLTESLFLYFSFNFLKHYGINVATPKENAKNLRRIDRVMARLIQRDGSFAMYSVNYHRAVCDILSLSKVIDEALNIGYWRSKDKLNCVKNMHAFLSTLVDPVSGRAPNIGHNDGSLHAVQFTSFDDFSPSVVFMGAVFSLPINHIFDAACSNVYCFGFEPKFVQMKAERFLQFREFGMLVVSMSSYRAFFKYPNNKFRPQQQDFLHLDLWVRGVNVFRDSGSYSYNPDDPLLIEYFDEAPAHNVPFLSEGRFVDRLSRFLYLEWPGTDLETTENHELVSVSARVSNLKGQAFVRKLQFSGGSILISDQGPDDDDWSVAYNLTTAPIISDLGTVVAPGVFLKCDAPVSTSESFYSTRYLDKQVGARLIMTQKANTLIIAKVDIQDQI